MAHASPYTAASLSPADTASVPRSSPLPLRPAAPWAESHGAVDVAARSLDTIKAILSKPQTNHDLSRGVSDSSMLPPSSDGYPSQLPMLSQPNVLSYSGAPVNVSGIDRFSSQPQFPYFASAQMFPSPTNAERYHQQLQYLMMAQGYPSLRPQLPQLPYGMDQSAAYDSSCYPPQFKSPMHAYSMMAARPGQDVYQDAYRAAAAGYSALPPQFNHPYYDQASASHPFLSTNQNSALSSYPDPRTAQSQLTNAPTLSADSHASASADTAPSPTISTSTNTSTDKSSSPLHPYFAQQSQAVLASLGLPHNHPFAETLCRLAQSTNNNNSAHSANQPYDHESSPFYNTFAIPSNRNRSYSDSSATSIASATLGQDAVHSSVATSSHRAPAASPPNAKRLKGEHGKVMADPDRDELTSSPQSSFSDGSPGNRKPKKAAKKPAKLGNVKLPRTAYVIFASSERKNRRDEMLRLLDARKAQGLKSSKEYMRSLFGQLTRDVAAAWKILSDEQKQPFRERAEQDKERFQREKQDFLASEVAGALDDEEEEDEPEPAPVRRGKK